MAVATGHFPLPEGEYRFPDDALYREDRLPPGSNRMKDLPLPPTASGAFVWDSDDYDSDSDVLEIFESTDFRIEEAVRQPVDETNGVEGVEFMDALVDIIGQRGRDVELESPNTALQKTNSSIGSKFRSKFEKWWIIAKSNVRPVRYCAACQETIPDVALHAPCGHYYDKTCMISLFEACLRDESLFHPRCCRKRIPFSSVKRHFSPDLRAEFKEKAKEYETADRVYCAVPRCSRFLGPRVEGKASSAKTYKCQCGESTCSRCKNACPTGIKHSCSDSADEGAETVLTLGRAEGWARCPGCRTMIELNMGCHHMTCLCKAEFCYICQARWKTCTCPQWDEARLVDAAEERIDIQLQLMEAAQHLPPVLANYYRPPRRIRNRNIHPNPPRAIPLLPARADLIQAAVDDMRVNHGCGHVGTWRYRDGGGRCLRCRDYLDRYVFECMDCYTIACNRCRLNRY